MGKHANSAVYRELERRQDSEEDADLDWTDDQPDEDWQRQEAIERYAMPVARCVLWDETRRGM